VGIELFPEIILPDGSVEVRLWLGSSAFSLAGLRRGFVGTSRFPKEPLRIGGFLE
jgi:hypothetical protein